MKIPTHKKNKINTLDNIEEAKIVSEKITETGNNTTEQKEEKIIGQKTVDLNDNSEKTEDKVVIDFMSDESTNNYIKKETKQAEPLAESKDERLEGKTVEELREQVKKEETEQGLKMTAKDYAELAKMLVIILDTIISSVLKFFAKDTSDTAYSISADKRKNLEYVITLVLVKYQSKFKIEILLVILLVGCYTGPVMKARERRKILKDSEINIVEESQTTQQEEKKPIENVNLGVKIKRGPGKPSKS